MGKKTTWMQQKPNRFASFYVVRCAVSISLEIVVKNPDNKMQGTGRMIRI